MRPGKLYDEVIRKFSKPLWYLGEETVALAFFDKKVPIPEKRKIVARLTGNTESEPIKRFDLHPDDIGEFLKKDLSHFVTSNTIKFFDRFDIDTEFLNHDPSTWLDREDYIEARAMMKLLKVFILFCYKKFTILKMKFIKVVNDTAERSVKLMSEYNQVLARMKLKNNGFCWWYRDSGVV